MKKNIDINNKLEQWLTLIDGRNKERLDDIMKVNTLVKKAKKESEYLTGDEELRRIEDLKEKWNLDYNSGIVYAMEKGEKRGALGIMGKDTYLVKIKKYLKNKDMN